MVREFEPWLVVTGVTKFSPGTSRSVGQDHAKLVQGGLLFFCEYEKFESTAQAIAVTHHRSNSQIMRFDREGKFEGDDFVILKTTAQSRTQAILAEFTGPPPAGDGMSVAKH